MNEAIGNYNWYAWPMGDAGGTGAAYQFRAEGKSAYIAARVAEDGISFLQAAESALLEVAALNVRLRELAVQKSSGLLATNETAAIGAEETAVDAAGDIIAAYKLNGKALLGTQVAIVTDLDGGTTSCSSTHLRLLLRLLWQTVKWVKSKKIWVILLQV